MSDFWHTPTQNPQKACQRDYTEHSRSKPNMFAENKHLELMKAVPVVDAWRGKLIFEGRLSEQARASALKFLVETPETTVRQAEVNEFGADHVVFDLLVEAKTQQEALEDSTAAALGGLMLAGAAAQDLASMHLASLQDLHNLKNSINSEDYDVTLDATLALDDSYAMYEEAAALGVNVIHSPAVEAVTASPSLINR